MPDKKQAFTVQMDEAQLRLVMNALECYFRLRMGQTSDLADDLAFQHYEYRKNDPEFEERVLRRDEGKILLDRAMDVLSSGSWQHWQKTPSVMTAIDMWAVIRNFFWQQKPPEERDPYTADASPVFIFGPEPAIGITKEK